MEYKINKFEITHDYDVQEAIGGSLEYGRFYTDVRIDIVSKDQSVYSLFTGKYSIGSILKIKYLGIEYVMVIQSMSANMDRDYKITVEISGSIRDYGNRVKDHYVEVNL